MHYAQLQLTFLNSNENEDKHPVEPLKKVKKSDVARKLENPRANEEEPVFLQAEEFNFSDPIVSSNHSNLGTNHVTFEQLTIPANSNVTPKHKKNQVNRKQDLNRQIKTEEQRIYKCEICGKDFGLKDYLNKHIKTVHEKKRD